MSATSHLLRERDGRVLVLTLNRPERHNAITPALAEELVAAVERADDDVRVVVIRGSGRSFCAGYDVSADRGVSGGRDVASEARGLRAVSARWDRLLHASLPVIAMVHGNCLAGGADLAGHCDLVVAAEDATIGFPAVRSMGVALTQMWIYHVGPQWAKRLQLTGDTMTGRLAAELGFALTAVPPANLEAQTMALAQRIALVGRELLIGNKYVVNQGLELMGRSTLQDIAATQDAMAHRTAPARAFAEQTRTEGLRAALAHRDAPFAPDEPLDSR